MINKKGDTRTCAEFLNSPRPAVNKNRCNRANDDGTVVSDWCKATCGACRRRRRLTEDESAGALDFVDMEGGFADVEGRYLQEDEETPSEPSAPRSVISLERCAFVVSSPNSLL